MHSITFHCRTLSPMFMGGADSNEAELRPPSVKGALRFWWRAMNANLVKDGNRDNLMEREAELFGNTTHRSSVVITCRITNPKRFSENMRGALLYMAYGAEDRPAYGEGTTFEISLSSKNKSHLEEVHQAFSLLTHLGGLGAKSRNGFGAFTCAEVDSFDTIIKYQCFTKNPSNKAPYTAIGNEAEIYKSDLPADDWRIAIKNLKQIYSDEAKSRISKKSDRVYIAAPYKNIKTPERHAKIHIMSLTMIDDELFYLITFLPYNYMTEYEGQSEGQISEHFKKWETTVFGSDGIPGFNNDILNAKDDNDDYYVNSIFNTDN